MPGLHRCTWAFFAHGEQGLLFVAVRGLLPVVPSAVVGHGLQVPGPLQRWFMGSVTAALGLWGTGSIVVVHALLFSRAGGSSQTRESNLRPFHQQVESKPPGKPISSS